MKKISEPSELLAELSIITQEEKEEIISRIDKDFLSYFENKHNLKEFSNSSNGMILPLSVGIVFIIITIFSILFFNKQLLPADNNSTASSYSSSSEWGVLKIFMEESSKKIETKEIEIGKYKDLIVTYDQKLTTLRELLKVKTETEERLAEERSKLILEGIPEDNISSKIAVLEKKLISDLKPDLIAFYDLSIEDLNTQIDQILDDKTVVEESLKLSIEERNNLAAETKKIEEEVESRARKISQVSEAINEINILTEVSVRYENEKMLRNQIYGFYNEILLELNEDNYNGAIEKIDELQNLLQNEKPSDWNADIEQLPMHINILNKLEDYVTNIFGSGSSANNNESEIELIISNISELTDKVLNDPGSDTSILAENELRSELESFPEISRALSVLSAIDNQKLNESDSSSAQINQINITEEIKYSTNNPEVKVKDTDQSASPGVDSSDELQFIGLISSMRFDRIGIDLNTDLDIKSGTEFYIFKLNDTGAEKVLGTGVILDFLDGSITGKLESLYISSSKPEINDLIYIKGELKN